MITIVVVGIVIVAIAMRPDSRIGLVERNIRDTLKCPSTAKFGPCTIKDNVATGYVDAENGFGAMIRAKYTCMLREENGEYRVVDLYLENK